MSKNLCLKIFLVLLSCVCAKRLLVFDLDEAMIHSKGGLDVYDPNICFHAEEFNELVGYDTKKHVHLQFCYETFLVVCVRPGVPELLEYLHDLQTKGMLDVLFWTNNFVEKGQIYMHALAKAAEKAGNGMKFEDFQDFGFISGIGRPSSKPLAELKNYKEGLIKQTYFINNISGAQGNIGSKRCPYMYCRHMGDLERKSILLKTFNTENILDKAYEPEEITLIDDSEDNCVKNKNAIQVGVWEGNPNDTEYIFILKALKEKIENLEFENSNVDAAIDAARDTIKQEYRTKYFSYNMFKQ